MDTRIFVYGSLRPGSGHPMAAWLAAHAVAEGRAQVAGRLYRVSWYPALVIAGATAGERVQGELFRLPAPALLAELDAYEEVRGQPDDEYRRERVTVWRDGRPAEAWAWVWQREVGGLLRVPGGDWLQQA